MTLSLISVREPPPHPRRSSDSSPHPTHHWRESTLPPCRPWQAALRPWNASHRTHWTGLTSLRMPCGRRRPGSGSWHPSEPCLLPTSSPQTDSYPAWAIKAGSTAWTVPLLFQFAPLPTSLSPGVRVSCLQTRKRLCHRPSLPKRPPTLLWAL